MQRFEEISANNKENSNLQQKQKQKHFLWNGNDIENHKCCERKQKKKQNKIGRQAARAIIISFSIVWKGKERRGKKRGKRTELK